MPIPAGSGSSPGDQLPVGITSLRLVDGAREMVLLPRIDVWVHRLDVPFPAVREVTESRTDDDGETDSTAYHGPRAVTVEMTFRSTPEAIGAELMPFCRPGARPYLYVLDQEWGGLERRLRLRIDQHSAPIGPDLPPEARRVLVQWKAPDGIWEAGEQTEALLSFDAPGSGGLTITATDGLVITAADGLVVTGGSSGGASLIDNPGTTAAHWTARLYGPATAPRLSSDTTGQGLEFTTDLTVPAGSYLELDSRARTALLNGETDASRLTYLDFSVSAWWRLQPGSNAIRYHPDSGTSAQTSAQLLWRPTYL